MRSGPPVGIEHLTRLDFSSGGRFLVFDDYAENIPGRESGEPATSSGEVYRLRNPFLGLQSTTRRSSIRAWRTSRRASRWPRKGTVAA